MFNFSFITSQTSQIFLLLAGLTGVLHFAILLLRRCLLYKSIYLIFYYFTLFILIAFFVIIFFMTLLECKMLSESYQRLQVFEELEKNHQLDTAKNNTEGKYYGEFMLDLNQFANSQEFKHYNRFYEEIITIGIVVGAWLLFVITSELLYLRSFYFCRKSFNKI